LPADEGDRRRILRRGASVLFVLYALFVVAVTTWPFAFLTDVESIRAKWNQTEWYLVYFDERGHLIIDHDLVLNIVFFMPFGAVWGFATRLARWWKIALGARLVGSVLCVFVESLQLLTPDRSTQIADLWRNALGSALGGLFAASIRRRLELQSEDSSTSDGSEGGS